MALFSQGLLPASFRGVPFAVVATPTGFGRRLAIHQYPGRDEPFVEDMGRDIRRYRIRGFLVANDPVYLGGPIALQRALLIAAAEKKGSGTLTHPTLGVLTVNVRSLSVSEALDAGTYSEVEFEFVEAGKQQFPSILTSSSGLLTAANLATIAIALDVVRVVAAAVDGGGDRSDISDTSAQWSAQIVGASRDATSLTSLTAQLTGPFGRYSAGGNSGYAASAASPYATGTSVADLAAAASTQRAAVSTAAAALTSSIEELTVTTTMGDVCDAASLLLATLLAACADPADAIRLLLRLIAFTPTGLSTMSALGSVTTQLFVRSAIVAFAQAISRYQPTSYDDAAAMIVMAVDRIDAVSLVAGDTGQDDTYQALRKLRVSVVQDLRARGGTLSPIRSYSFGRPLPALTLAQRLYRDPDRADQLVTQVSPVSPLFVGPAFSALAA